MSLDDEVATTTYKLICKDGEVEIQQDFLSLAEKIAEQLRVDPTSTSFTADITKETGTLIAEYLTHHAGNQPVPIKQPLIANTTAGIVTDPWDATFIDGVYDDGKGSQKLRDLSNGALLLQVTPLFLLTCAKWALLVQGKPVEEAQKILQG